MTPRTLARLLVLGLGAARLVEGVGATVATRPFLRLLGADEPEPGAVAGFRMKSGRDVALGLLTLAAARDDRRLAELAATAVVVDGVDGLAMALDGRATFGTPTYPAGAVLGVVVAGAAAWAARELRADL